MQSGADPTPGPDSADRKAELRTRLFSTPANDKIIPVPPPPREPKPENDAPVLGYVAAAFFVLAGVALGLSPHVQYSGRGPHPLEVLACIAFTTAAVVGVWGALKVPAVRETLIDLDDD